MPDGYHGFFSDGFQLTVAAANTVIDMTGWNGVAVLIPTTSTAAVMEMADDSGFTVNKVTPMVESDRGTAIQMGGGAAAPFWLEAYRPTKRYVRVTTVTGAIYAFLYRRSGNMPLTGTAAPNRAGGRVA